MIYLMCAVCLITGYLIGNIQTSVIISRGKYHDDVREHGSGNAGTTNMLRVYGMKPGILTFIGDFAKGIIAVIVGRLIFGSFGGYAAALGAVIGHDFPAFFGFRGGKGVATTFGAIWMFDPLFAAIATVIGFSVIFITRMVSAGSMIGFTCFVTLAAVFQWRDTALLVFSVILLALIIFRHIDNIRRLLNGTESRLFKRPEIKKHKS